MRPCPVQEDILRQGLEFAVHSLLGEETLFGIFYNVIPFCMYTDCFKRPHTDVAQPVVERAFGSLLEERDVPHLWPSACVAS